MMTAHIDIERLIALALSHPTAIAVVLAVLTPFALVAAWVAPTEDAPSVS